MVCGGGGVGVCGEGKELRYSLVEHQGIEQGDGYKLEITYGYHIIDWDRSII